MRGAGRRRTEALPHVNDPPAHLVAYECVLVRVLDVIFIQSFDPGAVPGNLLLLADILHASVVGVDDGHGEVNQGVLMLLLDVGVKSNISRSRGPKLGVLERW